MNIYLARNPRKSPLQQFTQRHFFTSLTRHPDDYQSLHGLLRPTIPQVVEKLLNCGLNALLLSPQAPCHFD
jgi:hypothetical protein